MNGILLLDKPVNITSFNAVDKIKKLFRLKKIGHAGTLDYFAHGLLIVGINEGTKILQYYTELDKEYVAVFHLGVSTDTYDINGKKIYEYQSSLPDLERIKKELNTFIGEIEQIPPDYSAVKIDGIRASDRKRKGMSVDLRPKKVFIKKIEIIDYIEPLLTLRISCSKGTYIRAIARDLGEKLGCGAYVSSLIRDRVGDFNLNDSVSLDILLKEKILEKFLIPLYDALPFFKKISLTSQEVDNIYRGKIIQKDITANTTEFLGVYKNRAVAILKLENFKGKMCLKPERVLFDI